MKQNPDQLSIFDTYELELAGCGDCICRSCLYPKSSRHCPKCDGSCYDDWRAKHNPYPYGTRKSWTDWNEPGEQEHWCRGGAFYKAHYCDQYVPYDDDRTTWAPCLSASIATFQDGYQWCPLLEPVGCEWCYEVFQKRLEANE